MCWARDDMTGFFSFFFQLNFKKFFLFFLVSEKCGAWRKAEAVERKEKERKRKQESKKERRDT